VSSTIIIGDCIEVMARNAAESIDAICTDPPYGLEFMGKDLGQARRPPGSPATRISPRASRAHTSCQVDNPYGRGKSPLRVRQGRGATSTRRSSRST
jgi:hypothetical protein